MTPTTTQQMYYARLAFKTGTNNMIPVITNTTTSGFKVLRHRPRNVVDLRHKGASVTVQDVIDAITRFQIKRAVDPDRIRVHRSGRPGLMLEASGWGMYKGTGPLSIAQIKVTL